MITGTGTLQANHTFAGFTLMISWTTFTEEAYLTHIHRLT
jgi:hypothetical protein